MPVSGCRGSPLDPVSEPAATASPTGTESQNNVVGNDS